MEFSLAEYSKGKDNTKVKIFIQYLYEKYGMSQENEEFDHEYFSLLNEEDLIESLEYYIVKNNVTAQVTASNYITYLVDFFDMLSKEYGIKNEIIENVHLRDRFWAKSKEVYSRLRISENKELASDYEYDELNNGINKFLSELVINDIYLEIDKYVSKEIGNVKIYNRFVSSIAIKLMLKFALKSTTTISLEAENLDMENGMLFVNDFELNLDKELIKLFKEYVKIRSYILSKESVQESKLFIKINGEAYIKYLNKVDKNKTYKTRKDYTSFFKIMDSILKTCSVEKFTTRRVLEMINGGVDIATVAKLSDNSITRCVQLQNNNNEYDMSKKLALFFEKKETEIEKKIISKKIIDKKEGYLNCPFCGKSTKGTSEEWILVQFKKNGDKYLSCSKCGGKSGN